MPGKRIKRYKLRGVVRDKINRKTGAIFFFWSTYVHDIGDRNYPYAVDVFVGILVGRNKNSEMITFSLLLLQDYLDS